MAYDRLHMSKYHLTELIGLTRSLLDCWGLTRHLAMKENQHELLAARWIGKTKWIGSKSEVCSRLWALGKYRKKYAHFSRNSTLKESSGASQKQGGSLVFNIWDDSEVKTKECKFLFQPTSSAFNRKKPLRCCPQTLAFPFALTQIIPSTGSKADQNNSTEGVTLASSARGIVEDTRLELKTTQRRVLQPLGALRWPTGAKLFQPWAQAGTTAAN